MKKTALLFAVSFLSIFSFAQREPTFGVKAGISSAGLTGDAPDNLSNLLEFTNGKVKSKNHGGFFAGGFVNLPVSNGFSVEPGVYFSQKGYELKGNMGIKGIDILGAGAKAAIASNYIDIPIYLKATTGGFSIFAGPQISYLVNSDLRLSGGVFGIDLLNKTLDVSTLFHKWDAAVAGGVSYKFINGIHLSLTYDYGLLKADANRNVSAYNNAIKAAIGLEF